MPYTVVTFPFLFSVMFGDVGHGAILVLVASFMIFEEEKLRRNVSGEIRRLLFRGRYVILLMGESENCPRLPQRLNLLLFKPYSIFTAIIS